MTLPESKLFFDAARREFDYLASAGFLERDTDESSLTAKIEFVGKHVAVSLALDRRDECMDCYVTRVIDGKFARNDVPGGYSASLHHFLVHRRRYRGGFREFREDLDPASWQLQVFSVGNLNTEIYLDCFCGVHLLPNVKDEPRPELAPEAAAQPKCQRRALALAPC